MNPPPCLQVAVGSIVRVNTTHPDTTPLIPADLTLLASSAKAGTCFLETVQRESVLGGKWCVLEGMECF